MNGRRRCLRKWDHERTLHRATRYREFRLSEGFASSTKALLKSVVAFRAVRQSKPLIFRNSATTAGVAPPALIMTMRILLTNVSLKGRSGTEVVTIEMASGLVRRGHDVVVFSPELGSSADYLRQAGIRVTDRLDELEFDPDVIHANHTIGVVYGLIRFPRVPAVFVCHDPKLD